MKTYILHLDPHDDITSARDKMGWGKSGRILLVWPERGRVLNRRLDLLLLRRYCAAQGAQLAIVARDPEVRYHAPRLGIPIFKSLRRAQSTAWRVPRRFRKNVEEESADTPETLIHQSQHSILPERPPPSWTAPKPAIRLLAFTVGVLAFLSIAALLLPSAEISLQPEVRNQEIEFRLNASPDIEIVEISGMAPAEWITVIVEGRDSLPVSGSLSLPDRPASGKVEFTNLTDQAVSIPIGTIVRNLENPPVRFAVTEEGQASAGAGQTLILEVQCLEAGTVGNLGAHKLAAIEGLIGAQVNVTNPQPMRGGRQRQEPAPSQTDRDELFTRLSAALRQTAAIEIEQGLAEGDLWWPNSLRLIEVLEEEFHPAGEEPSDLLELNLRIEFEALVISASHIQELAALVLDTNLPADFAPLDEPIDIEASAVNLNSQTMRWDITVSRPLRAMLSKPQIIQLSMGLAPEQASQQLSAALRLETIPQIRVNPTWWPRLPILPFRITIHDSAK